MILDALSRVASAQAATTNTTSVSTDSIDLGDVTPKRQIGDGEPMALVFDIDSITGAANTFTLDAISATAGALNAGVIVMASTGVKTAAQLPAGTLVILPIPPGQPTQRYIGARTTLGAADALTYSAYYLPQSFIHKLQQYATASIIK
jgi:hypothetical protein